jgi:ribulose-phosphate 3-epimerase
VLQLETPVDACRPFLDRIGMLTLLGTEMGIKGVGLDGRAGPRLEEAALMLEEAGHRVLLAADGGIREHTVPLLRKAGAETIVMGSLAFSAPNLPARMAWVHAQ